MYKMLSYFYDLAIKYKVSRCKELNHLVFSSIIEYLVYFGCKKYTIGALETQNAKYYTNYSL